MKLGMHLESSMRSAATKYQNGIAQHLIMKMLEIDQSKRITSAGNRTNFTLRFKLARCCGR